MGQTTLLVLVLITVLAFGLRVWNAGHLWLWGDEAWTLYLSRQGLRDLTLETARDNHPPLYYYLTYFWGLVAGSSEFALRLASIFPGTLVVPLTYVVGRRLLNRGMAVTAAALVALSPFAVHYSQEARMYALAMALGLLCGYLLLRFVDHPSWHGWALYGLSTFAMIYTLYSAAFFIAAHGLVLLLYRPWRRRLPAWLAIMTAISLLSVPWLLLFRTAIVGRLQAQSQFSQPLSPLQLLGQTLAGLLAGVTLPTLPAAVVASVLGLLALLGLFSNGPMHHWQMPIPLAFVLLPLAIFYPLHALLPWFVPRIFAFCAPWLYLLVAGGLSLIRQRSHILAVAAACLVLGGWGIGLWDYFAHYQRYDSTKDDYRPLIAHLEREAQSGDVVLYNARWHVGYFEAYYHGPTLRFVPMIASPDEREALLDAERQVWVVGRDLIRQPGGTRPEDQAEDWLSAHSFWTGEQWYGSVRLSGYRVPPPDAPAAVTLLHIPFDDNITLAGYALTTGSEANLPYIRPGQILYLTLYWEATGMVKGDYSTFTHVIGSCNPATGNPVWAQHDGVPGNAERPTTSWRAGELVRDPHVLIVAPNAPPGNYELEVGLYNLVAGARLTAYTGPPADRVVLAQLTIE